VFFILLVGRSRSRDHQPISRSARTISLHVHWRGCATIVIHPVLHHRISSIGIAECIAKLIAKLSCLHAQREHKDKNCDPNDPPDHPMALSAHPVTAPAMTSCAARTHILRFVHIVIFNGLYSEILDWRDLYFLSVYPILRNSKQSAQYQFFDFGGNYGNNRSKTIYRFCPFRRKNHDTGDTTASEPATIEKYKTVWVSPPGAAQSTRTYPRGVIRENGRSP